MTTQSTHIKTIMSFFKVTKYPPYLAYALITLEPAILFLYGIESVKNKSLFYYFRHVFLIHILAIIGIHIFDEDSKNMILTYKAFRSASLLNYGYFLFTVYMV